MIQINTLEEFKEVLDIYYLENDNVFSYSKAKKGKALNKSDNGNGYLYVNLKTKNGKYKNCLIHRLILSAYKPIENWHEMTVNHINHNRYDNRIENLEWIPQEQQYNDKWKQAKKMSRQKIMLLDKQNTKVIIFQSVTQCAKFLQTTKGHVSMTVKRGGKCKGYYLKN